MKALSFKVAHRRSKHRTRKRQSAIGRRSKAKTNYTPRLAMGAAFSLCVTHHKTEVQRCNMFSSSNKPFAWGLK